MTEPELLALLYGADDPRRRPRRTFAGAVFATLLPFVFVAAIAEPLVLPAIALVGIVGVVAVRRVRPRRIVARFGGRNLGRRVCVPGTAVCVNY